MISPKKETIIKKKGSTKMPPLSGRNSGNNMEDDSSDEEEEIEDIPKKRGRPKGSQNKDQKGKLIKIHMNPKPKWATSTTSLDHHGKYSSSEEEDNGKGPSKKIKELHNVPNWATFASPPEQHHHYFTSEEERLMDTNPMTGRKYSDEVKIEKESEAKSNSERINNSHDSPSSRSMEEKLALMKRQFEKEPPKNVKQHFETLWIYILQDPMNKSPYFFAAVALLNNRSKQPSSYLRSNFFSGALQGLAAADRSTPAVEKFRGSLSSCETVTLRRIEFGENQASSHEYNGVTYNHEIVKFMVKHDPNDSNAVPNFINGIKEILRSEMFFASIHQITLLGPGSGPSILDMRNRESPAWQYLRNPKNMMVASMTYLNQILLDEDIVKVLKKMYNRHWQDYLYVGWNKSVADGFTNQEYPNEYPIFRKK